MTSAPKCMDCKGPIIQGFCPCRPKPEKKSEWDEQVFKIDQKLTSASSDISKARALLWYLQQGIKSLEEENDRLRAGTVTSLHLAELAKLREEKGLQIEVLEYKLSWMKEGLEEISALPCPEACKIKEIMCAACIAKESLFPME